VTLIRVSETWDVTESFNKILVNNSS
jgi:hypothetical protein